MTDILNSVGSVLWGAPMLMFFLFTAVRFTIKSGFFQLSGAPLWLRSTLCSLFKKREMGDGISQFGAFCSVLAACIGTGNIVGVATAIYSGGPGAVFWMWISAVFSMMSAYAENYLGIKYKFRDKFGKIRGGAFHYIERGVGMKGLAKAYAVFCIFSTLGMGDMAQANSVTESLKSGFGANKYISGIIMTALCFLIISGGVKRISKASTIIVPFMSVMYLLLSAAVLIIYKDNLLPCVKLILREAFSLKALSGYGMFKAMRFGISRGVFSNEAGLGSSTIMHAETDGKSPESQGMWAMFEVFTDTVFLCTIMALVILVSGSFTGESGLFGAELSIASYSVLGEYGKKGIAALTAMFAFASLTGCSFYGEKSAEYLFSGKAVKPYKVLYLLLSFVGSITAPKLIWSLADIFNALMAVPNLFSINILGKEVEYPKTRQK